MIRVIIKQYWYDVYFWLSEEMEDEEDTNVIR